jgi:hypothetical protein
LRGSACERIKLDGTQERRWVQEFQGGRKITKKIRDWFEKKIVNDLQVTTTKN